MLEVSTRKPRKSRVVLSVCSRARYTRNPSLDIYLLSVWFLEAELAQQIELLQKALLPI